MPNQPMPRSRPLLLILILSVLLLGGLLLLVQQLDPQARAAREAAAYRQAYIDDQLLSVDLMLGLLWRVLPLIGACAVVGTGLVIAYRRWGTSHSISAGYQVQALRAVHQPGQTPQSLTYSPHMAYKGLEGAAPALLPAALDDQADAVDTPSMLDLLDAGQIGRGKKLILGYEGGRALMGSWLDLYATATAGLPGTGKTTSQRFFAAQTALHGARFVVCDPHYGAADDSLAATLDPLRSIALCEPASEPKTILEAVKYVADIGKQRVTGKDRDQTPIILWVDELTSLLGRSDVGAELAELLEDIVQQYRKKGVYVSASGQIWTAARTTSELRDSFASVLCHRMKRSQARLLLPTDEAARVERLHTGQAVLWRTNGMTSIVTIPNTTADDVREVADLLTEKVSYMPTRISQDSARIQPRFSQDTKADYFASERAEPLSAEAARIVALFLEGKDAGQIVTELTDMTSKRGAPYIKKLGEVQDVLRQELRRYA